MRSIQIRLAACRARSSRAGSAPPDSGLAQACQLARLLAARQYSGHVAGRVLYFEGSEPLTRFRDLERVATTLAAAADDGRTVPAGSHGTIVDVVKHGLAYAVEFTEPFDALVTLLPNELRSLEEPET